LSLSGFTVGFAMKNGGAIVLQVKEYFYRLEQISTPLGIAQTFCDQQNRSTGNGKTTYDATSWCRPGVICLPVSFLEVSPRIVFMDIIVDFAALFAM
jgi:hypothetical protein